MARPRKGPWTDGERWHASLPVAIGAKKQRQFSDPDETAVRRWYADGERELAAGEPLPDPAGYRSASREPNRDLTALVLTELTPKEWWAGLTPAHGHRIDRVAAGWMHFRYSTLDQAQADRREAVRADVKEIVEFFMKRGATVVEQIHNDLVAEFARHLAGRGATVSVAAPHWPELDGRSQITLAEAATLTGLSRSTVKRMRSQLPSWHVDDGDGRVRISVTELKAAASRAAGERAARRGLEKTTAANKLGVLKMILDYAEARGIPLTGKPMAGIVTVSPGRKKAKPRKQVPLAVIARAAAYMPVVHQLATWFERVLGVRISEGFGPRVGEFLDFGDQFGACLLLDRQGGRPFKKVVDGRVITVSVKERLKTDESHRDPLLPRQVTEMIRVVIQVFHTDPVTGEVDIDARIIPWLYKDGAGQQAQRTALRNALADAGIDPELYGEITPHQLRASLIEDLRKAGVPEPLARRYVGHIAGDDVHDRNYSLDPARTPEELQRWRPVTDALEKLIDAELGGTLMVPTPKRESFGKNNPLYARREHIYATLAGHGWFMEPRHDADDALLSPEQVAAALGIATTTARRQLREGTIPGGVLVQRGRRAVWMCPAGAVEAHREWLGERPTLNELAPELGLTYHQLYALIDELELDSLQRVKGGDVRLTPEAVGRLREEQDRRRQMAQRAIPVSVAAVELGVPVLVVENLLRRRVLVLDSEATTARERYVTRDSLTAYAATRTANKTARPDEPAVPDADARGITGLTRPGVAALVRAGVLVSDTRNRRRYITAASIEAWARTAGRDDVLRRLTGWRASSTQTG